LSWFIFSGFRCSISTALLDIRSAESRGVGAHNEKDVVRHNGPLLFNAPHEEGVEQQGTLR